MHPCKTKTLFSSSLIDKSIRFAFHLSMHVKFKSKTVMMMMMTDDDDDDDDDNGGGDDDGGDEDDQNDHNTVMFQKCTIVWTVWAWCDNDN